MTPANWVADECVSRSLVENLRAYGHDVFFVADQYRGKDDSFVLSLAIEQGRLLLTQDADYGELVFHRLMQEAPGVVFLRIPTNRSALRWPRLKAAIETYGDRLWGRFTVIEEVRTRSRSLRAMP